MHEEQWQHTAHTSVGNVVTACALETGPPKDQMKPAVDTSIRSVALAGSANQREDLERKLRCHPLAVKDPEDAICTWIECAKDQRFWAEVTEECDVALPCTPVPARVAGVGHKKASGHTEDPNHQVKPWLWERAEETDKLRKTLRGEGRLNTLP